MKNEKLILNIQKALGAKKKISENTKLDEIPQWDSMGALSIIGLADAEYKKIVTGDDLSKCETIGDIIKLF